MDGKYAKYIKDFMTNYDVNGEVVEIHTAASEDNQPLTYRASREIIGQCNSKLDEQYQIITQEQEEIEAKESANARKKYLGASGAIVAASIVSGVVLQLIGTPIQAIPTIGTVVGGVTALGGEIGLGIWKSKFEDLMTMISYYRKHRKDIETVAQEDENVTKYLTPETMDIYEKKKKLKEEGLTEAIFDIDFMDKLLDSKQIGKRDLITLLNMYSAVISMRKKPIYRSPIEDKKTAPKKRTKKKSNK